MGEVTQMLEWVAAGDRGAADQLLEMVYGELHKLAGIRLAGESPGHTLQPTALVNEAWMRLYGEGMPSWENKRHFFAAAAEAMRRILIESARRKASQRRGGGWERVPIEHVTVAAKDDDETVLEVHEAVNKLAESDPLKAEIVKLRYFVGLHQDEVAEILGISKSTMRRQWLVARSWLLVTLKTAR